MDKNDLKEGDEIYIATSCSISNGSSDISGGLATVAKITLGKSAGKECRFVTVAEVPNREFNWDQHLKLKQKELKKLHGTNRAHPDPDVDTPWVEEGDLLNGKKYTGQPIW